MLDERVMMVELDVVLPSMPHLLCAVLRTRRRTHLFFIVAGVLYDLGGSNYSCEKKLGARWARKPLIATRVCQLLLDMPLDFPIYCAPCLFHILSVSFLTARSLYLF